VKQAFPYKMNIEGPKFYRIAFPTNGVIAGYLVNLKIRMLYATPYPPFFVEIFFRKFSNCFFDQLLVAIFTALDILFVTFANGYTSTVSDRTMVYHNLEVAQP